jgi:hypothetical protein
MHVYSFVEIRIGKQKTSVMNNNMHGGIVGLVDGVDELGSEVVRRSEVRFSPSVKLTNTNNIDYLHWPYQKNNNMHACMINKTSGIRYAKA